MKNIAVATIDDKAWSLAEKYDLGIELDQFCTASFMDGDEFKKKDAEVRSMLSRAVAFHGPFNELSPCAIDPEIGRISMKRYEQAFTLLNTYGLKKMILHGGFVPLVYFPVWYVDRSIEFWKNFLKDKPEDFLLCLENVMEPEPGMLVDIVKGINDKRCGLCLDTGHANIKKVSTVPVEQWLEKFSPYLYHMHIHNNDGDWDWHRSIEKGTIDAPRLFDMIDEIVPDIPITLENIDDTDESVKWIIKRKEYR